MFTVGFYSSPIDETRGIGTKHKSEKREIRFKNEAVLMVSLFSVVFNLIWMRLSILIQIYVDFAYLFGGKMR